MRHFEGKRIGLLSAWASRANGGVFEAVVRQAELLRGLGAVPVVVALHDAAHAEDRWRLGEIEVLLANPAGPRALGYSPLLTKRLLAAELDLLHVHGIWHATTRSAGAWARVTGRPLVISPHGMMDPWITGRGRWKKALARAGWERRGWHSARLFHALTGDEASDIASEVGEDADIAVIANPAPPLSAPTGSPRPPMALYLGRIHPKKNLPALIEGWRRARPDLPADALLIIAGWGEPGEVVRLEGALAGGLDGIEFVGTAFGSQKAALLDLARFVVLPSLSEGLPMAVLEAWAAGVPTLMSRACHLPESFAAGAALDCGTTPDTIAAALRRAFALEEPAHAAMAAAARGLAAGPFAPQTIALQWRDVLGALLENAASPV